MCCGVRADIVRPPVAGASHGSSIKIIRLPQIEAERPCKKTSGTPMELLGISDRSDRKSDDLCQSGRKCVEWLSGE